MCCVKLLRWLDAALDALTIPNEAFCARLQGENDDTLEAHPLTLLYFAGRYNFGDTGRAGQSERVAGKRNIEDKVVERIVAQNSTAFTEVYNRIRSADWYVLSARKADILLRKLLFERVFAMKTRGFAQQFRGAELDMHFSLKTDLVTFKDFLHTLKQDGQTKMASLLERGTL
jgi:hypothetical protein